MATLSIRKLDDDTYERLKLRAAADQVSMEEEVRRILNSTVAAPKPGHITSVFRKHFSPDNHITLKLARKPHEPMDFQHCDLMLINSFKGNH